MEILLISESGKVELANVNYSNINLYEEFEKHVLLLVFERKVIL